MSEGIGIVLDRRVANRLMQHVVEPDPREFLLSALGKRQQEITEINSRSVLVVMSEETADALEAALIKSDVLQAKLAHTLADSIASALGATGDPIVSGETPTE